MLMEEVWRDVLGYEGLYQVSNYGRVKSLHYRNTNEEGILRLNLNSKTGYYSVIIDKKRKTIHRLVCEAFIPNPMNFGYVNHKDENKKNNFVWVNTDGSINVSKSNLEWCTHNYNLNYGTHNQRLSESKKISAKHYGEHHNSKQIIRLSLNNKPIDEWDSLVRASNALDIPISSISGVLCGHRKTAGGFIWKYKKEGD